MQKNSKKNLTSFLELPCIYSVSSVVMTPYWAEHWHVNRPIELIHVLKGKVKIQFSYRSYIQGNEGNTLIIPPSIKHKDYFDKDDTLILFYIHFGWQPIQEYLKILPPTRFAYFSKQISTPISKIFEEIKVLLASGGEIDSYIVQIKTLEILLSVLKTSLAKEKIKSMAEQNGKSRKDVILEEAFSFIQQNYKKPITMEDVANHLKISPFYLSHIFNQKSDLSFNTYLNNIRLEQALLLLKDPKVNISEVSYAVGYDDNHYFSRIFKKKFGVTPSQARMQMYRKQIAK